MDITTVITFIKQVFSTLLTLLMMMSPALNSGGAAYSAKNPDELVMSFCIVLIIRCYLAKISELVCVCDKVRISFCT